MKRKLRSSNPKALRSVLTYCINGVLNGTVTSEQAHAISKLTTAMLKVFETIELEDRLKELELKLGIVPKSRLVRSDIQNAIRELSKQ